MQTFGIQYADLLIVGLLFYDIIYGAVLTNGTINKFINYIFEKKNPLIQRIFVQNAL